MIEHTQEPWTMGKPPYHGNEIHGVDRADGSRQLVAQVYGYSREEVVANMRRITACVNACAGIPTETLEAGEVVPLALVDSIIREVLTNEEKYVPAAMLGNQGLNAYHGIMREIRNALSRFQQSGEQAGQAGGCSVTLTDVVAVPKAALEWLAGGRTGLSSKTMCYFFLGVDRPENPDHPHDASDLGRCLGLLDAVPEWRSRLPELASLSAEWAAIVAQWDVLEELYRKGDAAGCSKALWALLEGVRRQPGGERP